MLTWGWRYATNHEPLEQHTFMQLRGVNVEQRSPIGEILAALVGAVVGFVLFFIGFPVVYLNEQREVSGGLPGARDR